MVAGRRADVPRDRTGGRRGRGLPVASLHAEPRRLVLELEIWPYHYDVSLTIRSSDKSDPLVELRMKGSSEIHCVRDGNREALHFVGFYAPRSTE